MAKGAYVGVDGVARKIKKGYVGVDSKARKIKKAYVGVGGVARPCWGGGELSYYGTITPLSVARYSLDAITVGGYALFGSGHTALLTATDVVDAYNDTLVRMSPSGMELGGDYRVTTTGGYAIFGGGSVSGGYVGHAVAYSTSLVKTSVSDLSVARIGHGATTVGKYALFGGGYAFV